MRLDKFLKVSRIIKRRPVAKKVCDGGKVSVNDRTAKSAKTIAVGDILNVDLGSRGKLICEVLEVPKGNVSKKQATSLYKVLEQILPSDKQEGEWARGIRGKWAKR